MEIRTVEDTDVGRARADIGRTYAEPLSGLKVSWGSILAGAVAMLAVTLMLWALALAIVLTATNANIGSVRSSLIALAISGLVATLVGAVLGGALAGYLPGNPRRVIAITHSFLAWAVAFVVASALQWAIVGGAIRATTGALASTTGAALQTTGAAVGGVASGQARLDVQAQNMLQSLGYAPSEARAMVQSGQQHLQDILRGRSAPPGKGVSGAEVRGALDEIIEAGAKISWTWWITWALACGLALVGGTIASRRLLRAERWTEPRTPAPPETAA
jgi:hypothetical protein